MKICYNKGGYYKKLTYYSKYMHQDPTVTDSDKYKVVFEIQYRIGKRGNK